MTFKLKFPSRTPSQPFEEINLENVRSLTVVGANGSGKSRLGVWLEKNNQTSQTIIHRISAQRSIELSGVVKPEAFTRAQSALVYAGRYLPVRDDDDYYDEFKKKRWENRPVGRLLYDFEAIMTYLFAGEVKRWREYVDEIVRTEKYIPPPPSNIDQIQAMWKELFPQRQLMMNVVEGSVTAKPSDADAYSASQMSDGERVAVYLMAQTICAPVDTILIIDEPEIHLHKAIISSLWNELENARPDCLFIYLTHDLEFAASRARTKKIWLKDYCKIAKNTETFSWEDMPEGLKIPDALLLKVLGSRRAVLFVEGEINSLDYKIYTLLFANHLIIPCGGHQSVIESTKALRNLPSLHYLQVVGVVDRDFHNDEYLSGLEDKGVYAIGVAEVENLLCIPEIIIAMSTYMRRNSDEVFKEVQEKVFSKLAQELDGQALKRTATIVENRLAKSFGGKFSDLSDMKSRLQIITNDADLNTLYTESVSKYQVLLDQRDYIGLLKFYNQKGIAPIIADSLGLGYGNYVNLVLGLLNDPFGEVMVEGLRRYVPSISSQR